MPVKSKSIKKPVVCIASMVALGGVSALHSPVPVAITAPNTWTGDASKATCEACLKVLESGRI
jgi:hypothetical protein